MAYANVKNKKRVGILLILSLILFFVIVIRLFYVQIIKGDYYQDLAYKQQTKDRSVKASRGTIYDSAGNKLAVSVSSNVLTVAPTNIASEDKSKVAENIASILEIDVDEVLAKLNKRVSSITIATNIEKEKAVKLSSYISEQELKGVYVDESTTRVYPYGSLLSHVLGFVGTDNQGLSGVEIRYDEELSGVPGKIVGSVDGGGNETPYDEEEYIAPQDGYDLVLTVDATTQSIVEKNLEKAVLENEAEFGMCVIMRPNTGEVLSMATYPDFDPNEPFTINDDTLKTNWDSYSSSEKSSYLNAMWRNKCISDAYEPGSIFKVVTATAALEEGVAETDKAIYSCTGSLQILGWTIKCWRYPLTHGTETLRQGVVNSCNPVFMRIALDLGKERYCKFLEAYNLYGTTGIDLYGETKAIAYTAKNMTDVDLATTGFGQNISVTAIQMATVYSAIANGGYLLEPYIVKEIKTQDGSIISNKDKTVLKQVISKDTADKMLSMLYDTVNTGTSKAAQATGYTIAGKTGTAEEGRGANKKYMASFAGIAPYNDPEIVIIISIYNPTSPQGHMGGVVAAPVAGTIIEEVLRYMDVDPNFSIEETDTDEVIVPELSTMTYLKAKETLSALGLSIASDSNMKDDEIIDDQIPKSGASLSLGSTVRVYNSAQTTKETTTVPDVRGVSSTYAEYLLKKAELNIRQVGVGNAIIQDPSPGEIVTKGSIVTVKFVDTTDLH